MEGSVWFPAAMIDLIDEVFQTFQTESKNVFEAMQDGKRTKTVFISVVSPGREIVPLIYKWVYLCLDI